MSFSKIVEARFFPQYDAAAELYLVRGEYRWVWRRISTGRWIKKLLDLVIPPPPAKYKYVVAYVNFLYEPQPGESWETKAVKAEAYIYGYVNEKEIPDNIELATKEWIDVLHGYILKEAFNDEKLSWVYEIPGVFDRGVDTEEKLKDKYSEHWDLEAYLSSGNMVRMTQKKAGKLVLKKVVQIKESELY